MKKFLLYFSFVRKSPVFLAIAGFFILHSSLCIAQDSTKIKLHPYILFSGGGSLPWPEGYGGNTYHTSYYPIEYSGFANAGSLLSITAGLIIYKGWEVTGMFSKISNSFNASSVLTETLELNAQDNGGPNYPLITNVDAIGTYYYSNYSFLTGITKNIKYKNGSGIGFSIMAGRLITHINTLHGLATDDYATASSNPAQVNCYFNLNTKSQNNPDFEFSFHADIKLINHIFLRTLLEFQFSNMIIGGNYQFANINTGTIAYSANYNPESFFVGLFNATAGLGYKF